jgi:tryptophan halogenase
LKDILIVGGGSSGWMTATTLISKFPNKNITVIEPKNIPTIGVGESTTAFMKKWLHYVDIPDESFFPYTDASYKMSIKFVNFAKEDFHYPFGIPFIYDEKRNPYHDWQIKKFLNPKTKTEDFVSCLHPSYHLFTNNKFSLNENQQFSNYNPFVEIGYHFDAIKFANWLRDKYCLPKGVKHITNFVKKIDIKNKQIDKIILDDEKEIRADLYIDCTGFKSLLLGEALKTKFISFSDLLPNDAAWGCQLPYKNIEMELEPFTTSTAYNNGWIWNAPLWSRIGTGYVFSSKYISKENALKEFKEYLSSEKMIIKRSKDEVENLKFKYIPMKTGIYEKSWVKNVVAIGLSAAFIEPLESNGLYTVHEFLYRLVKILEKGNPNEMDKDMYNLSTQRLFNGFAEFVMMHYSFSSKSDTKYWQDIQNKNYLQDILNHNNTYPYKGYGFQNFYDKYLDLNEYPFQNSGQTYIAIGNNYFSINSDSIRTIDPIITKSIDDVIDMWENQKNIWHENAKKEPTMYEYLKYKYYNKNVDVV